MGSPTGHQWSIIGADWQHEDDFGMSLKLNLLPIAVQDVVIRRVKPENHN